MPQVERVSICLPPTNMAFKRSTFNAVNRFTAVSEEQKKSDCDLFQYEIGGRGSSSGSFTLSLGDEPRKFEPTWNKPSLHTSGGLCAGLPNTFNGDWDRLVENVVNNEMKKK